MCLLCPRHVAENTKGVDDGFNSQRDYGVFTLYGKTLKVAYHLATGLPFIHTAPGIVTYRAFLADTFSSSDAMSIKPNLTPGQRAKLILHERFNHISMKTISTWIQSGILSADKSIANCEDLICRACQFGKVRRQAHAGATGKIASPHTAPGQGVSADQLEAGYPGRMPTTRGFPTARRYKFVNIWVDHYSHYIYPTFHETKDLKEMLASKAEFEASAAKHKVSIASIRADNGVYAAPGFKTDCDAKHQQLTFCAVGGHWQNGVAERYIGHITRTARILLLHAMEHWPGTVTEEFWSFAIRHACTFHNASVRLDSKKSPHHMFTGSVAPWRLDHFRVFGSPAYVLDKRLQDGDSLAKWKSRSWLGVYIGHSLVHAGNVPVIYNPVTTHISPQYHVVFDNQFTSVGKSAVSVPEDFFSKLFSSALWEYQSTVAPVSEDLYTFDSYWLPPVPSPSSKRLQPNLEMPAPTVADGSPVPVDPLLLSSTTPTSASLDPVPMIPALTHSDMRSNMDMNMNNSSMNNDVNMNAPDASGLPSKPRKLNLVKAYTTSLAMKQWQDSNGIDAAIYKVHDPSAAPPIPTSLLHEKRDLHDPCPELSLLSYAHLAAPQIAPEDSQILSSNKEEPDVKDR
jgi:hypothetical protein